MTSKKFLLDLNFEHNKRYELSQIILDTLLDSPTIFLYAEYQAKSTQGPLRRAAARCRRNCT